MSDGGVYSASHSGLWRTHRSRVRIQCCFTSTETVRVGKPRTATSTFTQLLSFAPFSDDRAMTTPVRLVPCTTGGQSHNSRLATAKICRCKSAPFKLQICICGCTRTRYRAKFFLVFPILALTNNDMKAAKS